MKTLINIYVDFIDVLRKFGKFLLFFFSCFGLISLLLTYYVYLSILRFVKNKNTNNVLDTQEEKRRLEKELEAYNVNNDGKRQFIITKIKDLFKHGITNQLINELKEKL